MTITLQNIKDQVLARADMSKTGFIGNDELIFYINQERIELYDLIVSAYEDYFFSSVQFTLNGTTDGYSMPSSIYKLRGVDKQISGNNNWQTINRYNFNDRNKYNNAYGAMTRYPVPLVQYSWNGATLNIIPTTQNAGTYKVSFIPHILNLDDGYNTVEDPILETWIEYVIVGAAIKCLGKEESDASLLVMQKQLLTARIQAMAPNKDDAEPKHVSDSWACYDGLRGSR